MQWHDPNREESLGSAYIPVKGLVANVNSKLMFALKRSGYT